ncbi:MAG: hypothetical protein AAF589_01140 [Planctomycetota bacterium]
MRNRLRLLLSLLPAAAAALLLSPPCPAQEPINVGFLWHMHQPTYRPGETIHETEQSGVFSFELYDVHGDRFGPYTTWPNNAIQSGTGLPHLGAQVSFSGSLIRNLDQLEAGGVGGGQWNNWKGAYQQAASLQTAEGNRRLDLVNFGLNHPLMPLLDTRDIQMQIRLQKHIHTQTWGASVPFSKGIFPPETAFSTRIIPALVAEGIEWSIVDSIHLERAVANYPHTNNSNIYAPNRADQINPAIPDEQWVQLNGLWAPSKVAAPFAYRPHHVQHVDPATGEISKIVAVPAARYEGNEDGRGGFGALQYELVMEQYRQLNTDPEHPMFVLLHHDGDNFGGGSESYYNGNFNNMINWASGNANYDVTTVQDYLDRFPVDAEDVVHIESGSWAGADAGDPEFKKWLGDPDPVTGWSPDRNSWAVLTAAKNHVFTADDIAPATNHDNIINGVGSATERAWHTLLQAEASDHWYWDGTEVWDSNVTLGSNQAVAHASSVLSGFSGTEATPPTVFVPQRESYNPGGDEYGDQPSDFEIWTYAYDVSGLESVQLKYRLDGDGFNPLDSIENETYAGGAGVGDWITIDMASSDVAPPAGILTPTHRALRYGAMIEGHEDVLLDYYVEAIDANGNVQRTDIQHVYVGSSVLDPGGERVMLDTLNPVAGETVRVTYDPAGGPLAGASGVYVHYGFNDWAEVAPSDPLMNWNATDGVWELSVPLAPDAEQLDLAFNNGADTWDSNGGADWHFAVVGAEPGVEFIMDGQLDAGAVLIAGDGTRGLWVQLDGDRLYVATNDAGEGADVFIYLAETPGDPTDANWAKSGQVAAHDAFLADENDNDYEDWFGAVTGEAATGANGGVLEGVIDLTQQFGEVPEAVYLAVAAFATADGGALLEGLQLPGAVAADGDLTADEFVRFAILAAVPGDYDGNGSVGLEDLELWRQTYGSVDDLSADGNQDGIVDGADYAFWRNQLLAAAAASSTAGVPEPTSLVLLALLLAQTPGQVARAR